MFLQSNAVYHSTLCIAAHIEDVLLFLLGFFSTIALFPVSFGKENITPFNFFLYLIVIWYIITRFNSKSQKKWVDVPLLLILLCSLISSIVNINIPSSWLISNFVYFINHGFLFLFVLFFNREERGRRRIYYLRGFYLSSWIQLIWGFLQYIYAKQYHISLNKHIFIEKMGFNHLIIGAYDPQRLRLTGLHWESAYYALALIIGYILSNKVWKKGLFTLGILLSSSRTGILSIAGVIAADIMFAIKKRELKVSRYNFLTAVGFSVCFIVVLCFFKDKIVDSLYENVMRLLNGVDSSYLTHLRYYELIPDIFLNKFSWLQVLFGTGWGSSGYIYTLYYGFYPAKKNTPWVADNELVNRLVGCGLVGTILSYYWFIRGLKNNKYNKCYLLFLLAVLTGGITYSYFVNWVWIVAVFMDDVSKNDLERLTIKG